MEEEHSKLTGIDILFIGFVGVVLLLNWRGLFTDIFGIDTAIIITLVGGYRIFQEALVSLWHREIGGDLAVAIAAGSALAIGEYLAAGEVIFIMLIGGALESYAVERTHAAIEKLAGLLPDIATVRRGEREEKIPIAEVVPGDTVLVRPGERIPVDGAVLAGRSAVNQAALTGESLPAEKAPGDEVYTGTLSESGYLEIRATGTGENTQLGRVIRLVEEAQREKAPVQRAADRYAAYFVPAILSLAAVVYLTTGSPVRAIATLIVVCPCAFVLATPTAIVAAMGRLARRGILVKGGPALEQIGRVDCVAFDKTGTLTEGELRVAAVVPAEGHTPDEALALAAAAERGSGHLLAGVLVAEAERRGLPPSGADSFETLPGLGIAARSGGRRILVGSPALMEREGIAIEGEAGAALAAAQADGRTVVLVAAGGSLAGVIAVEDRLRPEAAETIVRLRAMGVRRVVMLTGDAEPVARRLAALAGIDEVHAGLFPEGKVAVLCQLKAEGHTVAMLGDGINDAPSLATADVGITLGGIGTDVALEAAGIVFMTDDLGRLPEAMAFSRRMLQTVATNIRAFALGVNGCSAFLAGTGVFGPIGAAVMHQIASLLVVGNSLRLLLPGRAGRQPAACAACVPRELPAWAQTARLRLTQATLQAAEWARAHRPALLRCMKVAALLLYAGSGLYRVGPGEVGVVRRFGRLVSARVCPGLHYEAPWPIARVVRVPVRQIQRVEIGYRSTDQAAPAPRPWTRILARLRRPRNAGVLLAPEPMPASVPTEWNTTHPDRRPEESVVLTGDENLLEVTLSVQYDVKDAAAYLFHVVDPEGLVRAASESVLRDLAGQAPLDDILTVRRAELERRMAAGVQRHLDAYQAGIRVDAVCLQDVHPPAEVVGAYRDVASAMEEKGRAINQAEGYRLEQVPLARGQATQNVEGARGYTLDRANRSAGDAARFSQMAAARKVGPGVTDTRLMLETMEQVLPGPRKFILDKHRAGRRQMLLLDEKGEPMNLDTLAPATAPPAAPEAEP